ncbi:hypothetical protein [Burkholderia territorii]|uniref:hypothetical protein n=1 Tax=Burkholderia territorii TaxID=1503055 RepID=UPI0012D9F8DF|nr:hypothetical protein [Burkholderia territorii]
MAVSDEIELSMTAIMTAFASGENRSILNQPFPNGKAWMAASRWRDAPVRRRDHAALSARKTGCRRGIGEEKNRESRVQAVRDRHRYALMRDAHRRRGSASGRASAGISGDVSAGR